MTTQFASFDEHGWTKEGWHQIHWAALEGDVKQLTTLLDKNSEWVDLEEKNENSTTPLVLSAQFGAQAAVELLLDRKANVNKQCGSVGWTALLKAADWGRRTCVRILLERKANRTHTVTLDTYENGRTALDFALSKRRKDRDHEIIAMLEAQPAPEAPPAPFPTTDAGKEKLFECLISN